MPEYVVARIREALLARNSKLRGARILVVGVAYKKDVRDLRQSPSIDIIKNLGRQGAQPTYFDPLVLSLKIEGRTLKSAALNKDTLAKFDCVVIATDHSAVDYKYLLDNAKLIFDTRNVYGGRGGDKVVAL